jgi:hypothetical protein
MMAADWCDVCQTAPETLANRLRIVLRVAFALMANAFHLAMRSFVLMVSASVVGI